MTVKSVKIIKNKVFRNKKGNLVKYISKKNKFFIKFGEIYFNEIKKGNKKGWNLHKKNNCLIICVYGKVEFILIDKRKREKKITLSSNTGKILKIPPKVWFAFKSIKKISILANLIERPHQDSEVIKKNKIKNYLIK